MLPKADNTSLEIAGVVYGGVEFEPPPLRRIIFYFVYHSFLLAHVANL